MRCTVHHYILYTQNMQKCIHGLCWGRWYWGARWERGAIHDWALEGATFGSASGSASWTMYCSSRPWATPYRPVHSDICLLNCENRNFNDIYIYIYITDVDYILQLINCNIKVYSYRIQNSWIFHFLPWVLT